MRCTFFFATIMALVFGVNAKAQSFYHQDSIPVIELEFFNPNWESVLEAYKQAGLTTRLLANATINGEFIDSVGVRFKGNSTFDVNNAKNPLNIQLDYTDNSDYDGYRTLKLSNGKNDPSFVREVLSYEIARNYMVASLCNFVKVYTNGDFYGVFSNSESVNTDFTNRYIFGGNNGARFQCNPVNVGGNGSNLAYLGANESSYYSFYELDSDTGWFKLVALCDTLNNYPNQLDKVFDIDRALWMLAFNNVMVNLDSYTGPFRQNYYLLENDRDLLVPALWDLNECLGGFEMINTGGGPPPNLNDLAELNPLLRQGDSDWPLLEYIFSDDRLTKQYMAHFRTIYDEQIKNDLYYTLAQDWQNVIAADLQADPNALYTFNQTTTNLNQSVTAGGGPNSTTFGIKELFDLRKTYVESNTEYIKEGPVFNDVNGGVVSAPTYSNVTITTNVSNADEVILGYRFSPKDSFVKINMPTSGNNNFEATIPVEAAELEYYFYAENSEAGSFSPARAEFEYHKIGIVDDLVINELLTSNAFTQFDEAAQYDDWIELYNNSANPIDITGYYLADNKDSLNKWEIPNITIDPDEYLIFWADKEELQGTQHTNFRLTKNGESLYLSDANLNIVDQVTYPHQFTDLSYSRVPNGIGPFIIQTPTFKAVNDQSDNIKDIAEISYQFYPNPTDGLVVLELQELPKGNRQLSIVDMTGSVVYNTIIDEKKSFLNIPDLKKGIYVVSLGDALSFKLVKL